MEARFGFLTALVVASALASCDRAPVGAAPTPSAPPSPANDPTGGLAPPLLPPGEESNPVEPSYDVSIATAAANRNNALARCATQPESVRAQCEQEANAAFGDAEKSLEPLRGNQQ